MSSLLKKILFLNEMIIGEGKIVDEKIIEALDKVPNIKFNCF